MISFFSVDTLFTDCLDAWRHRDWEKKCGSAVQPKKMCVKSLLSEAATALQLVKSWPEESPCREELALVPESDGMDLADTMVRHAVMAGEENVCSELLKIKDLTAWTRVKI